MDKKIILYIIIIIIVLAGAIFAYSKFKPNGLPVEPPPEIKDIILFYGDTCSYCKILEQWMSENKIEEKIEFSNLEIFNNEQNKNLLIEKAGICKLDLNKIAVPFLWTGETCVIGSDEIQNFFQQKLNLNINAE